MSSVRKKESFHSGKRFSELSFREKLLFLGKACIFFASGGFIYSNMWID